MTTTDYGWSTRPSTVSIAPARGHRAPRKLIKRRRGGCERRPGGRRRAASRAGPSGDPDSDSPGEAGEHRRLTFAALAPKRRRLVEELVA